MTEGKPYLPWLGSDDRIVVEEMLRDPLSEQWYECREFVKKCIYKRAKNIPKDNWDDIVQDAMMRVNKFLPTFRYQCAFRTWLFNISHSSIIDAFRKFAREGQHTASSGDQHNNAEQEDDVYTATSPGSVEDKCITQVELSEALAALQEYVSLHANPVRNARILDLVLLEGRSLEEAAKAVGCSAPLAGYVVRSAQRYVRERVGHRINRPSQDH